MKISKRSWHYRFQLWIRHWDGPFGFFKEENDKKPRELPPTNLCDYFWSLVFLAVVALPLIPFIYVVFIVIWTIFHVIKFAVVSSVSAWHFIHPPRKDANHGIVVAYAIAVKKKFCPLLEWED